MTHAKEKPPEEKISANHRADEGFISRIGK